MFISLVEPLSAVNPENTLSSYILSRSIQIDLYEFSNHRVYREVPIMRLCMGLFNHTAGNNRLFLLQSNGAAILSAILNIAGLLK